MVSTLKPYTNRFYDEMQAISVRSSRQIVPLVLDLVPAKSVVDIGCGIGCWLNGFVEQGVQQIFGVDGAWVDTDNLLIPRESFMVHDLKQPLKLERTFDLVVSLEVAEHLPGSSADNFVQTLTSLGPVVLFSAAVPFQGGTNHINEQWPEYWAEIFASYGYKPIDCIREKIWKNQDVAYWFAQNMILFVREDYLQISPKLQEYARLTEPHYLSRVHPKMYLKSRRELSNPKTIAMKLIWNALPRFIRVQLAKRMADSFWEQVSTNYS